MSAKLALLFLLLFAASVHARGSEAPKPLYRDPIHDGAADPTIIWNRGTKQWWLFYTNRRADMTPASPKDVSWLHGTHIGIATSSDGAHWTYKGVAEIPNAKPDSTFWAPEIVEVRGKYHMYLTLVPGIFKDWNAPREIDHLTSRDLVHWTFDRKLDLASNRVIDPCVFPLGNGKWRMWYKDEAGHSYIHQADSVDLSHWTESGIAVSDIHSEGPKVFRWRGQNWLIVDAWKGLAVYRSADLTHWQPQATRILEIPGTHRTDRNIGHHCDVIVSRGRAYIFYFTHQSGLDLDPELLNSKQRTVLQVAELRLEGNTMTADRDTPTQIHLAPGASFFAR
ncbi:family 43 glycosylhydrolase [Acidipila sp. EB88]|uniref:family 43 glycosylhydrolase n=1 Tax=Acidipila sp. EB88 TaxID=2305226 RepID=UPI000F600262|nr:family 43 glycosylhydrolase [Acidipila sp. EB88]RRA47671.1 glycosyl hydrolase [Acidipila sp. EB88]